MCPSVDPSETDGDLVTDERVVPVGDGEFRPYRSLGEDRLDAVAVLAAEPSRWSSLFGGDRGVGTLRLDVLLSDSPVARVVAARGVTAGR